MTFCQATLSASVVQCVVSYHFMINPKIHNNWSSSLHKKNISMNIRKLKFLGYVIRKLDIECLTLQSRENVEKRRYKRRYINNRKELLNLSVQGIMDTVKGCDEPWLSKEAILWDIRWWFDVRETIEIIHKALNGYYQAWFNYILFKYFYLPKVSFNIFFVYLC